MTIAPVVGVNVVFYFVLLLFCFCSCVCMWFGTLPIVLFHAMPLLLLYLRECLETQHKLLLFSSTLINCNTMFFNIVFMHMFSLTQPARNEIIWSLGLIKKKKKAPFLLIKSINICLNLNTI